MWIRIVVILLALIIISFLLQWLLPKGKGGRRIGARQYLMWDIAPLLGFFGVLLLGLSFLEAARQQVLGAWALGDVLGLVLSGAAAIAWSQSFHKAPARPQARVSPLRIVIRVVRTYGLAMLVVLLALNLAVRLLGAMFEMFMAGGLGILTVAMAGAVFATARRLTTD